MSIIDEINIETDIEKLRNKALTNLKILYEIMLNCSYKSEVYEFIIGSFDLSTSFEYYEKPKVSIVIPVKNEFIMTSALLNSIKHNTQGIEYEVIIADDNSNDDIENIENIFGNVRRIVNNTGYSGFIHNMNNAISKAKGEYIFSMNNDMITLPSYLSELLKIIEADKTIGIAGSKTLNIDGTVQECGVKMLKDGKVEFLGKNKNIDYMDDKSYLECDYCSGCSILFKREIWEKAGGFDINLAPAYYDDSDFAFNLKYNFGLKSVCVPKSKIFHFKNISYKNTEATTSLKNRYYFLKKWEKYLKEN